METEKPIPNAGTRWLIVILGLLGALVFVELYTRYGKGLGHIVRTSEMVVFIIIAPLTGLYIKQVGIHKLLLTGVAFYGVSTILYRYVFDGVALYAVNIGIAIGGAIVITTTMAYLFLEVRSYRWLATTAGIYLALKSIIGFLISEVEASLQTSYSGEYSRFELIFFLGGIVVGGVLIGISDKLRSRFLWPEENVEMEGGRFLKNNLIVIAAFVILFRIAWTIIMNAIGQLYSHSIDEWAVVTIQRDPFLLYLDYYIGPILIVCGFLADLLDRITLQYFQRPLGRQIFLLLGMGVECVWAVSFLNNITYSGFWHVFIIFALAGSIIGVQFIALILKQFSYKWWGLACGLYISLGSISSFGRFQIEDFINTRFISDSQLQTSLYVGIAVMLLASLLVLLNVVRRPVVVEEDSLPSNGGMISD